MIWRAITENDLQQKCTDAEFSAIAELFYDASASVAGFVRGYVAASGVEMDTDPEALPDRIIGPACDYLLVDLYRRLGGTLVDPKGHRKQARDDAIELFEAVARGRYSIADPLTQAESSESKAGASRLTTRPVRVNRTNLGGF